MRTYRKRWITDTLLDSTGRNYRELKNLHCFECEVELKVIARQYKFLKACAYAECRVLLCPGCLPDHEAMHQLAQDEESRFSWRKDDDTTKAD
jgi:hypothetical protein